MHITRNNIVTALQIILFIVAIPFIIVWFVLYDAIYSIRHRKERRMMEEMLKPDPEVTAKVEEKKRKLKVLGPWLIDDIVQYDTTIKLDIGHKLTVFLPKGTKVQWSNDGYDIIVVTNDTIKFSISPFDTRFNLDAGGNFIITLVDSDYIEPSKEYNLGVLIPGYIDEE